MYLEGEELGLDWRATWERIKAQLRQRRDEKNKVPVPKVPRMPSVPGPPPWLLVAAALYLAYIWE